MVERASHNESMSFFLLSKVNVTFYLITSGLSMKTKISKCFTVSCRIRRSHIYFTAVPGTDDKCNTFCEPMRQKDFQTTGFATQDTAGYTGLLYSEYVMLCGCNFSMEGCNVTVLSTY
jgi:hypothetical protein